MYDLSSVKLAYRLHNTRYRRSVMSRQTTIDYWKIRRRV